MKALEILKSELKIETKGIFFNETVVSNLQEAIKELEELEDIKNTVIEEIEYAIAKPEYASVYLNNAIRFLRNE